VDDSTLYVDASLRRVGIGTATPEAKLHVAGDLKVDGKIIMNGAVRWYSGHVSSFQTLDPNTKIKYGPFTVEGAVSGEYIRAYSPVILPDGAEVVQFIAHGMDTDATSEMTIIFGRTLFANPINNNLVEILSTDSVGVATYESVQFDGDVIVDNEHYSYWVKILMTTPDPPGKLRMTGYRIKYKLNQP